MCGRYYISDEDMEEELLRIIAEAVEASSASSLSRGEKPLKTTGEIFPSDYVPICASREGELRAIPAIWGMPINGTNQRVINTRAETGAEKPMYIRAIPCAVPATNFFEWETVKKERAMQLGFGGMEVPVYETREKIKRSIYPETKPKTKQETKPKSGNLFFMAGLLRVLPFMPPDFTIVTLPAAESLARIHDRMPSVLNADCAREWVSMEKFSRDFIFDSSERQLSIV